MELMDQALMRAIVRQGSRPGRRLHLRVRQEAVLEVRRRSQPPAAVRDPGLGKAFRGRRSTTTSRRSSNGTARTCISWPETRRASGSTASWRACARSALGADFVREAIYEIMPRKALDRFETRDGTDFAYTLGTIARFRVNVLRQLNGMGAVFRAIPCQGAVARAARMPEAVRNLCKVSNGLILVTGQDRIGQVDDARGDDRRRQFDASRDTSSRSRTRSSSCTRARTA